MSRLLVLGNAGLDISLPVPRLPGPGETLVGGMAVRAPGGKGLNQATVAARSGLVPVGFCAPVGEDGEGREIARRLRAEDFAVLNLPATAAATDLSVLLVSPDGENSIVTSGGCAAGFSPGAAAAFAAGLAAGDWLLLQGNLGAAATLAALEAAASRGARVMLNTAPLEPALLGAGARSLLARCAVVVANGVEARALTGEDGPAAVLALRRLGAARAVVTLGGQGCLLDEGEAARHIPAPAARVVDTTGAGDTFCGLLAALLAAGRSLEAAVVPAQHAAALSVARPGAFAALPSTAELRALVAT
ncbi:PfkB family carbohydrate kinase [Roseomonas sp. BN140053]|uniref:PfkB family carbohydrate kinase n=1 Tax=Roseomonas sp. BN140053 TaxID=3391898 RepID=UPI0039E8B7B3